MARCRYCDLYDVEAVKNARGAVMSNRAAKCNWFSSEPWPESINNGSRYQRPSGSYMQPNREHDCQTFAPRKDER